MRAEPPSLADLDGHLPMEIPSLPVNPLVSILVTCHNRASFVGDCLRSALTQTYKSLEIVVCDDCSTDESLDVISDIASHDFRVKLVTNSQRQGVVGATNKGYSAASGSIICLLDSDDLFRPDKVERLVQAFRIAPRSGVALHPVALVGEDGETIKGIYPSLTPIPKGALRQRVLMAGGLLNGIPPTSGISLRREVAELLFPLSGVNVHHDLMIVGEAATLTEFTVLSDQLARYRIHPGNLSGIGRRDRDLFVQQMNRLTETSDHIRQWLTSQPSLDASALVRVEETLSYSEKAIVLAVMQGRRVEAWRASRRAARSAEFAVLPATRRAFIRVQPFMPARAAAGLVRPGLIQRIVSIVLSKTRALSTS